MSYSGDAAEQVVRMTLEGAEVAAKITGAGAKQVAVLLYAILRDQKKTKGKTRLVYMLRSGKELKVFAVRDTDLQQFCIEAKKYGVLYCVLKDKSAADGITDIMVRTEDAAKINRIFERFHLATADLGELKGEIERARETGAEEKPLRKEEAVEQFLDVLLGTGPEGKQEERTAGEDVELNPTMTRTGEKSPSAPTSRPNDADEQTISDTASRPSVRQELKEIREEQKKQKAEAAKVPDVTEHRPPRKKREHKER